ncbi:VOC family protein [bacterium]|nr:VOC family protein [bacterium]
MAQVKGIGGVFFRAEDPEALGAWYAEWLGLPVQHPYGASLSHADLADDGLSVWCPFKADTDYFGPSGQAFMINLIVDDLDGALAQVAQGGAEVVPQQEDGEFGRFGWFVDPAGNRVELWQPPA